jgi:hypothetical protein
VGGAVAFLATLSLSLSLASAAGADAYPGTTTVTTTTVAPGGTSPGGTTSPSGGTPPGGSTSPSGSSSQPCVVTVTIPVGNTQVVVLTGCAPSATFSITVAGVATGLTVNSDSGGTVSLTTAVTDPHLSVNGSTPASAVFGSNTVSLTNTSGGAGGTEYVIIPNATTAALGSGSSSSGGTLAFTGADLLALIIGALFLLAMGTLLVVFTRRRASHQQI